MDALTVMTIVVAVLLVLGFIFWVFLGVVIFLGAATMGDVHDDFPTEKDFENRKTK
jgi:cytochrome c oxidase assembly factor CtaG